MDEDIVLILVMGLIMLVGVGGITIRLALKPIVDSIARLMEVRARGEQAELVEKRVALLEHELQAMRADIGKVLDKTEFDRQLGPPRT